MWLFFFSCFKKDCVTKVVSEIKILFFCWCHQFGVAVRGSYELVVHGIQATLDVHPNWAVLQVDIVNAFNIISHRVVVKKLRAIGGQLF
jgi:hypothetical protein